MGVLWDGFQWAFKMAYVTFVVSDMKEENPAQKVIQFPPLRDEAYLQQNILQEKESQK
jgi:hypothetical protein